MSGINLPNIKLRTMSLEELETELQENKERDIKYRQLWEKFKNDGKSIQEFNLSREKSQFYFSHGFSCHTNEELKEAIKRKKKQQRREITLFEAGEKVLNELTKSNNKKQRVGICRDVLEQFSIRGKPTYTAEQLANYTQRMKFLST